ADTLHARAAWQHAAAPLLLVLNAVAIAVVWKRRSSALDLWLLLALWALVLDTTLEGATVHRFSVDWYAGQLFGLLSSGVLLAMMVADSPRLYALTPAVPVRYPDGEARQRAVEVMIASIVHELNQPLCAILLNSDAGT